MKKSEYIWIVFFSFLNWKLLWFFLCFISVFLFRVERVKASGGGVGRINAGGGAEVFSAILLQYFHLYKLMIKILTSLVFFLQLLILLFSCFS